MASTVHRSFLEEGSGPEASSRSGGRASGELVRCPHCSQHFYSGGEASGNASPEGGAHEFDREHAEELGLGDRTRKYDREFDHYYGAGEADEAETIRHYARGGRVDGAGKVDGIHLHPSECSHLASGGVCRHQPPGRKPAGSDHADEHVRNFADGGVAGEHDSFAGYLARRRSVRSALGRGK